MTTSSNGTLLAQLRAVVTRLAESGDSQIPYLVALGSAPSADELAREFDAVYPAVAAQATEVDIPHPALESLVTLNETLLGVSGPGHYDLWTTDPLIESQWWSRVRKQAAEVLLRLDA